ncbi:MAG TPA: AAA family ATPase [Candidatus Binatia bacterium]|nr:AAA family ATPase [Candidatus Binatia bacterium]
MYEKHFGFLDLPFRVTPEPVYFYTNPNYREALATLYYGIEARKGFIVITGEVGTGKTTLLKIFMGTAEPLIHTAFVYNPTLSFTELLRFILDELAIPHSTDDKSDLMEQLNGYLLDQLKKGQFVALLLDEAQSLTDGLLEELRLLSNFETYKAKLIQIVLMGQPELEQRLEQPNLRQLKQRIALRCRLAPLKNEEVRHYIGHRLATAGYKGTDLFERKAIERITFYSSGIPRLINVICDSALLIAYGGSKHKVSAEMIEEVARDLKLVAAPQIEKPVLRSDFPKSSEDLKKDNMRRAESGTKQLPAARGVDKNVARLATAILLVLLLVSAGGTALYYQRSKDYLSQAAGGIKDRYLQSKDSLSNAAVAARHFVDTYWDNLQRVNLIPESSNRESSPDNAPKIIPEKPADSNALQTAAPQPPIIEKQKDDLAPVPKKNEIARSEAPKSEGVRADKPANAGPTSDRTESAKPQRSERRQYSETEKPAERDSLKSANARRFFRGHFEVVEESVVVARPQRDATVVVTLTPGAWIRVEEQVGNYLRIRSLNDPEVRGYVHIDNAVLDYIGFTY